MITKQTPLKKVLKMAAPCRCSACSHGCRYGSGFLAEGDDKSIAKFLKVSEEELKRDFLEEKEMFNKKMLRPKLLKEAGKAYGQCVFYSGDKGCTIHKVKPLECRTSISCKDYGEDLSVWFTLNHMIDANDPESIRQYSQYVKSKGRLIRGALLEDIVPDKEKLKKILSYELLK